MLSDFQYFQDSEVSKMSTYMMMPKDYARELMHLGQREKASAFMEYMFDLDEKKNNSIGFYSISWEKSKSTVHAWVTEFKDEIAKHFDFWTIQNELKYRTVAERQPNDFQKKSNAKSTENTSVKGNVPNALPNDSRTVAEQSINTINNKESNSGKKQVFSSPTIQEIKEFIESKNLNVDASKFYYHYESNGWMIGKNKMKSWTATIMNWNARENQTNNNVTNKKVYGGLI